MGFVPGPSDPFYELMQPPPDETPAQATARQKRELDAQRINDRIDEEIKQERARAKKERNVIKLLLLGQSESGKSTTLKNFRMRYAKEEWEEERSGWRSVVQLNIVRSITTIIRIVEAEMNGDAADSEEEQIIAMEERDQEENEGLKFTDRHQLLMIRLAPLLGVEAELKRRLGAGAAEPMQTAPMAATPFELPQQPNPRRKKAAEFSVRSWKDVLDKESRIQSSDAAATGVDLPTMTLAALKDDMKALWQDKTIQQALQRNKVQLSDSAGFFLNDLDRIATRDYVVTDNDIVRARLRTVGIQEHKLVFSHGPWDNAKMSPVSVFDQWLEEDPRVNRLEDSIILWTSICQSKLLAKTQLILFLNKCDLLRRKLKRGVKVNQYLPSYGDKPNEVISVVKYLREKFKDIQKQCSPEHRSAYIYPTTVTDTEATAITLESVRDGVLRENLAASQLI
ncbi:heterotrimeric G protein alpha subunit, variant 2 [Coprinopsis cinerea AmutBmut pab1-1]|nr:heterotrimeric G protein alpha subunit, variant 2 [Coprinopsis cinerea AmutBmut pab1-1]